MAYVRRGDARLQAAGPDARRSFTGQGTIRAALQDYQKAIELNSNDPAAQEGHGDANVAMGDSRSVDAAIVDYSYAIAAEPTAPRYAKRAKAYAYFGAPLVDKALADYSSALALDDKWAGGYLARARLYMQKTDPGRALADYTKSIDIEPTAIAYRERAALFEKIKHDHEAALSDLNKALALDANDQDAKTAVASIEKQKFAEACMKAPSLQARWDACTDFLIRDRNSFAGHYQRGLVAAAMGNAAGAVIDFGLAATIDPKNWQAWFNLGTAYANEQKFDLAVEDFTQVTKLNPQFAPAYYARGLALSKLKKPDQAIADHSKAIELNPKLVGPYVSRASLYEAKGDLDRAIDDYDDIIKLIPNVPDAFEARGKLYRAKGDRKRAEADFNIADALRRHDNAKP